MTKERPPIPAAIWARLLAFLKEGRTGEIVLNVHAGSVRDGYIKERIREEAKADECR